MRHALRALGVAGFALLTCGVAQADTTPNPLRFVPKQAELVAKIENPKHLVESLYYLDVVKKALEIDAVREFYQSTSANRFYQLIAFFEKELGKSRFELLDELAGGGAVVAMKISKRPTVLAILQGKNEKLLRRFVDAGLDVAQHELDRQQAGAKIKRQKYRDVEVFGLGNELVFGVAGSAFLFSNRSDGIKAAIDLYRDGDEQSVLHSKSLQKAKTELEKGKPAGWLWLDLKAVRKIPQFQQGLKTAEIDPIQTFLFGGIVNVLKRAPYLTVGLFHSEQQLRASIRMPAGRNGMAKKLAYFVPKDGGALPPLAPKNALLSTSFYLDWKEVWEHRNEVLPDDIARGLEKLQKQAGVVLGGTKFSELLAQVGPHQRVVVAYTNHEKYTSKPTTVIPSFALVMDMRDPKFAKHMNGLLRGAAFFGALQFGLKIDEKKYKGQNVVSYYFPDKTKVKGDPTNIRYNFSPTFAKVGDDFLVSSTAELARAVIDDLVENRREKESTTVSTQTQLFASGAAAYLDDQKKQVLAQFILDQGLSPGEAENQFNQVLDNIRSLGGIQLQVNYAPNSFHYDIRFDLNSKSR